MADTHPSDETPNGNPEGNPPEDKTPRIVTKQDIGVRACAVLLKSPRFGWSSTAISDLFGNDESGKRKFPPATINAIYRRTVKRGFDPTSSTMVMKDEWFADGPRSGRPRKHPKKNAKNEEPAPSASASGQQHSAAVFQVYPGQQPRGPIGN